MTRTFRLAPSSEPPGEVGTRRNIEVMPAFQREWRREKVYSNADHARYVALASVAAHHAQERG